MLHVRRVLECNRSQEKSWGAKSGWMDDSLRGGFAVFVRGEDYSSFGLKISRITKYFKTHKMKTKRNFNSRWNQ